MTPDETVRRLRDVRLARLRELVGSWERGALRGRRGLGKLAESLVESAEERFAESLGESSRDQGEFPGDSSASGICEAPRHVISPESSALASPALTSPALTSEFSPPDSPPDSPPAGAGFELAGSVDLVEPAVSSGAFSRDSSGDSSGDLLVSTGSGALDRLLARGGLERGSLVEWFSEGRGGGAGTLAWLAAREASRRGGGVVVFDRRGRFYPPAAAAWGVDPRSLAVVRAATDEDERWAAEQALRSPAVAAVWIWRDELSTRDFRRWQLAAEASGALGLLLRPARARGRPTWAEVQWSVRPSGTLDVDRPGNSTRASPRRDSPRQPRARSTSPGASFDGSRRRVWRLEVELVRCRGGRAGTTLELELDDVTGEFREAEGRDDASGLPALARLADSATSSRTGRG